MTDQVDFQSLVYGSNTIGSLVQPYLPKGWRASIIPNSNPDDPVRYSRTDKTVFIPTPPNSPDAMTHYIARVHTVLGTVDKYGVAQMEGQSKFKFYKKDGSAHPVAWVYNDLLALSLYSSTIYEGRKDALHKDMEHLFKNLDYDSLSEKMVRYHKALASTCNKLGMDKVDNIGSSNYLDMYMQQELRKDNSLKQLYNLAQKIIDKLDDEDSDGEGAEGEEPIGSPDSTQLDCTPDSDKDQSGIGRPEEQGGPSPNLPSYSPTELKYSAEDMIITKAYKPPVGTEVVTVDYTVPRKAPNRYMQGMPGSQSPVHSTPVISQLRYFDGKKGYGFDGNPDYAKIVAGGLPLSRQLRAILTEETRSKQRISNAGRLVGRNLYMLPGGGEATYGSPARNQFVQRTTAYEMKSHLTVLCDLSGSMGGAKAVYAAACLNVLFQALQPLRASFSVLGFTDLHVSGGVVGTTSLGMKRIFDSQVEKRPFSQAEITDRLDKAFNAMHANPDTDAVMYAALDALNRREAKRHLVLVLSDGQPSSSRRSGSHPGQLKELVAQIEATPSMTIFGIGILTESVRRFYADHAVIKKIADVMPVMLDFVEHNLVRKSIV